jgi:hypothetical protein
VKIGNALGQRPSIDAVRRGVPQVAWAPSCAAGGSELYILEAEVGEPLYENEWMAVEETGAENACDPSLSLGTEQQPAIANVDPAEGTVRVAVRNGTSLAWGFDTIDEGAQPSMDYNELTQVQTIAYVDPISGELSVVDGFWY